MCHLALQRRKGLAVDFLVCYAASLKLQNIQFKFKSQGHWVKMTGTGALTFIIIIEWPTPLNTMPAETSMCDTPGWGEVDVLSLEVTLNCLQPGLDVGLQSPTGYHKTGSVAYLECDRRGTADWPRSYQETLCHLCICHTPAVGCVGCVEDLSQTPLVKRVQSPLGSDSHRPQLSAIEQNWEDVDVLQFEFSWERGVECSPDTMVRAVMQEQASSILLWMSVSLPPSH